ncbi:site-2 protease family protein [Clostridiisalibacter paucivorans]|uniref:site-2 protease family protein n=1 Tax=Clostridiisalibacter paucivorans TaxID=408753 RepID=UPI00068531C5|nr:site-2 protease family protein [Clostridiisalibacter paucivorans]
MDINNFITSNLLLLPGLLIAITFHELAHGYAAYMMGDPTAKNQGRLTLNPIKHIDPIGFMLLITVKFGWAKPVPINPIYFKKRKTGMIIVSLAGPLTNFVLAIISAFILASGILTNYITFTIFKTILMYNIVLGIFNLLPFPPLDGSKVFASLLPTKYEVYFYKYEKYLYLILIILLITGYMDYILWPLINITFSTLLKILAVFF